MMQIKIQRGIVIARTIWRATITAIGILLLCVPPAWAATICNCQAETGSLHACCLTSENEQADIEVSSHCKTTPSSSSNSQVRKSSQHGQHAMSCCEASPQSELESAALSPTAPMGAEENNPLPVDYRKHISKAPPSINNHPLQPQRPLYLALSSWLI